MFKATMRDNLGWMKDVQVITVSMVELLMFINRYADKQQEISIENITKLKSDEELIINTKDGLKLTITCK